MNISRLCIIRSVNLERRLSGRRHWIGGDGRIRTPHPEAQCKGIVNAAKKWKLHIPSRRWKSQNFWERTASENIHLNPGSPTPPQEDSTRDDEEAKSDFWTITGEFIRRHHVEPRVKLNVPREELCLIPLKYIDVTRTTYTSLDVLLEIYWRLLERGWRKRIVRCLDRLHKIHFLERKAPHG